MKRLVLTLAVALVACASAFAQKSGTVVWEYPTVGYTSNNQFTINKVEFGKDRTSVHINNQYPSDYWFMFSPNTYIEVDGKQYTVTGSDSIELGKQSFTDSRTWEKDFVLHFPRLPKPNKIKSFNLMESTNKGDFKFYAIHPKEARLPEAEVPAEFLANYPEEDIMPKLEYSEEPVKIHLKALNWQKGMEAEAEVDYINVENAEWTTKRISFDDEGCAEFSAPIYYPMGIQIDMSFRGFNPAIRNCGCFACPLMAPGKEITIAVDMFKEANPITNNFVGVKGYLAKKNYQTLIGCDSTLLATFPKFPAEELDSAKSAQEVMKIYDAFALQDKEWHTKYGRCHGNLASETAMKVRIFDHIARSNPALLASNEFRDYIFASRPDCFWGDDIEVDVEMFNLVPLFSGTDIEGFWPDICRYFDAVRKINAGQLVEKPVIYDPDLSKLYDRVTAPKIAEMNKLKETKAANVHLQDEIGNISPTDLLQYIIDKHKGKTILIDKWEVWCVPCRQGHKEMAPMKEEEKYKDVVFIYLASPSSDLRQWMELTKEIPGEHYYLNSQQSTSIGKQLKSEGGVPAYAIFNTEGEMTFTQLGWGGVETIRTALDEVMK